MHAKSIGSQEIRALLVARKQLLGKLLDVELSIRGILRGFGLKVGQVTRKTFEARIWELVTSHLHGAHSAVRVGVRAEINRALIKSLEQLRELRVEGFDDFLILRT